MEGPVLFIRQIYTLWDTLIMGHGLWNRLIHFGTHTYVLWDRRALWDTNLCIMGHRLIHFGTQTCTVGQTYALWSIFMNYALWGQTYTLWATQNAVWDTRNMGQIYALWDTDWSQPHLYTCPEFMRFPFRLSHSAYLTISHHTLCLSSHVLLDIIGEISSRFPLTPGR